MKLEPCGEANLLLIVIAKHWNEILQAFYLMYGLLMIDLLTVVLIFIIT